MSVTCQRPGELCIQVKKSTGKCKGQEVPAPWLHPLPYLFTPSPHSVGWGQRHHPEGHPSWLPLGAHVWDAWRPPDDRAGADRKSRALMRRGN